VTISRVSYTDRLFYFSDIHSLIVKWEGMGGEVSREEGGEEGVRLEGGEVQSFLQDQISLNIRKWIKQKIFNIHLLLQFTMQHTYH
jgi:hypothetical protein